MISRWARGFWLPANCYTGTYSLKWEHFNCLQCSLHTNLQLRIYDLFTSTKICKTATRMILLYWNVLMGGGGANQSRQRPGSKYSSVTTQRLRKRDDGEQEGRWQRSLRKQLSVVTPSHDTVKSHVDFITQIQFMVQFNNQTSQINSHPEKA